jgi:hypothetical protein
MGEPARLRLKVRHHEVDAYGHVNHAHYVHYLESARVEVLESLGLGLPEMRQAGYLILAAELSVKYHAPAYAAETLEVITSLAAGDPRGGERSPRRHRRGDRRLRRRDRTAGPHSCRHRREAVRDPDSRRRPTILIRGGPSPRR